MTNQFLYNNRFSSHLNHFVYMHCMEYYYCCVRQKMSYWVYKGNTEYLFFCIWQDRFISTTLNPHSIVPSIPSAPPLPPSADRLRDAVGEQTGIKTHLVGTQLESLAFPQRCSAAPVLEPWEEATLRRSIQEDLGRYRDSRLRLKDVYVVLAGTDRRLTGYVSFDDLGHAFNRCNVSVVWLALDSI